MATLIKTFDFNTSLEGWSLSGFTHSDGELHLTASGRKSVSTGTATLSVASWADLGVPSGATVNTVIVSLDAKYASLSDALGANYVVTPQSLVFTHVSTSMLTLSEISIPGGMLATMQTFTSPQAPAQSPITFTLDGSTEADNDKNPISTLYVDNIVLTIDYTLASSDFSGTANVESTTTSTSFSSFKGTSSSVDISTISNVSSVGTKNGISDVSLSTSTDTLVSYNVDMTQREYGTAHVTTTTLVGSSGAKQSNSLIEIATTSDSLISSYKNSLGDLVLTNESNLIATHKKESQVELNLQTTTSSLVAYNTEIIVDKYASFAIVSNTDVSTTHRKDAFEDISLSYETNLEGFVRKQSSSSIDITTSMETNAVGVAEKEVTLGISTSTTFDISSIKQGVVDLSIVYNPEISASYLRSSYSSIELLQPTSINASARKDTTGIVDIESSLSTNVVGSSEIIVNKFGSVSISFDSQTNAYGFKESTLSALIDVDTSVVADATRHTSGEVEIISTFATNVIGSSEIVIDKFGVVVIDSTSHIVVDAIKNSTSDSTLEIATTNEAIGRKNSSTLVNYIIATENELGAQKQSFSTIDIVNNFTTNVEANIDKEAIVNLIVATESLLDSYKGSSSTVDLDMNTLLSLVSNSSLITTVDLDVSTDVSLESQKESSSEIDLGQAFSIQSSTAKQAFSNVDLVQAFGAYVSSQQDINIEAQVLIETISEMQLSGIKGSSSLYEDDILLSDTITSNKGSSSIFEDVISSMSSVQALKSTQGMVYIFVQTSSLVTQQKPIVPPVLFEQVVDKDLRVKVVKVKSKYHVGRMRSVATYDQSLSANRFILTLFPNKFKGDE